MSVCEPILISSFIPHGYQHRQNANSFWDGGDWDDFRFGGKKFILGKATW